MVYKLTPNKPIPLSQVVVGAVGYARWRGVPKSVKRIDSVLARLAAEQNRDKVSA